MTESMKLLNDNFVNNSILASALVPLLPASDRPYFRNWLFKLREIYNSHKELTIRNDYMWFMLLMLQNRKICEPFNYNPPQDQLKPLRQMVNPQVYEEILTCSNHNTFWVNQAGDDLNSTKLNKARTSSSSHPSKFLDNQPTPRNGIICYMAAFSDQDY